MRIEYLATGEELLDGRSSNQNAVYLGNKLTTLGQTLTRITTVSDDLNELKKAIQERLEKSDILIISGGLGPTDDDRTREAISQAIDAPLVLYKEAQAYIQKHLKSTPISDQNLKQAYAPANSELLFSGLGTAPGICIHLTHKKTLYALPGVPQEFQKMLDCDILPKINEKKAPNFHITRWTIYGISEANCQSLFTPLYPLPAHLDIGFKASLKGLQIQLKNTGQEKDPDAKKIHKNISEKIAPYFLTQSESTIAEIVSQKLKTLKLKLSLAESCTGGWIAKLLTDLPGASSFLLESAVTYSNQQKQNRLNVSPETLQTKGAVSESVAKEMAEGSLESTNSDISLSITGIAGPSQESTEKPVGLVWFAIADSKSTQTHTQQFSGSRTRIREKASNYALWLLYKHLNN